MPPDPLLLDCRGLRCPLPVLKLEKQLKTVPPGTAITLLATDPMAKVDVPLFCRQNGHAYTLETEDGVHRISIISGAAPSA